MSSCCILEYISLRFLAGKFTKLFFLIYCLTRLKVGSVSMVKKPLLWSLKASYSRTGSLSSLRLSFSETPMTAISYFGWCFVMIYDRQSIDLRFDFIFPSSSSSLLSSLTCRALFSFSSVYSPIWLISSFSGMIMFVW